MFNPFIKKPVLVKAQGPTFPKLTNNNRIVTSNGVANNMPREHMTTIAIVGGVND